MNDFWNFNAPWPSENVVQTLSTKKSTINWFVVICYFCVSFLGQFSRQRAPFGSQMGNWSSVKLLLRWTSLAIDYQYSWISREKDDQHRRKWPSQTLELYPNSSDWQPRLYKELTLYTILVEEILMFRIVSVGKKTHNITEKFFIIPISLIWVMLSCCDISQEEILFSRKKVFLCYGNETNMQHGN